MQAISAQNVRLRSAYRGSAYNTWNVGASGYVNNYNANWANACAPIVITSVAMSSCLAAAAVLLTNHKESASLAIWPNNTTATRRTSWPASAMVLWRKKRY